MVRKLIGGGGCVVPFAFVLSNLVFQPITRSLTTWYETNYVSDDCQCGKSVRSLRDHFMADYVVKVII